MNKTKLSTQQNKGRRLWITGKWIEFKQYRMETSLKDE